MINNEKFNQILADYKRDFPARFQDEVFKWQAVKHFQDHWDIDAPDFAAMYKESIKKCGSLLGAFNFFPGGVMLAFAKAEPEVTREMFRRLFDESVDLVQRVKEYIATADELLDRHRSDKWNNHYQKANSVSTFLWLRYPDNYYIYKYGEIKAVAETLGSEFTPKRGGDVDSLPGSFALYDEMAVRLQDDSELQTMFHEALPEDAYSDPKSHTLAIDFGFYISRQIMGRTSHTVSDSPESTEAPEKSAVFELPDGVNAWWLMANPKYWSPSSMPIGGKIEYTVKNSKGNARKIARNFQDAKAGDFVFCYESTPTKQLVAFAEVSRPSDGETIEFAITQKLPIPLDFDVFKDLPELQDAEFIRLPQSSLLKVTPSEYSIILDLIEDDENEVINQSDILPYGKQDFEREVYMEGVYDEFKDMLEYKKNIILQGAPGTGKTFAAKRLAYAIMGETDKNRIEMIQFHQNYSYEDFVMGFRPTADGGFELREGIFYQFCQKAATHPNQDYFFIIDEINRGNLSKVLGELFMAIEDTHRGEPVTLSYSGKKFAVPENLYIIGMMNTADRSIAMIDYALRRRFCFKDMEPAFDSKGFKDQIASVGNADLDNLVEAVKSLNEIIAKDPSLGPGFRIGHSYFSELTKETATLARLYSIVKYEIIPTLQEYWQFDEPDTFKAESDKLLKAIDRNVSND